MAAPETEIVVLPLRCGGDVLVIHRRAGERDGRALFIWSRLARPPEPADAGRRGALARAARARARAVSASATAATLHAAAAELHARHAERLLGVGDLDGAEMVVERACAARVRERSARRQALGGVYGAAPD